MLKDFLKRILPQSDSAAADRHEKLTLRLARIEGLVDEQVQRQSENNAHMDQMAEKLSQALKEAMEKYESALETHRSWEESLILEAVEGHRQWEESFLQAELAENRKWEEAIIEALRQWAEASNAETRAWGAKYIEEAIERHRQWAEASNTETRAWGAKYIEEAIERHRQWAEASNAETRAWEGKYIAESIERHRQWAEASNAETRAWEGKYIAESIERHRQWEEAAHTAMRSWGVEAIRNENRALLSSEESTHRMLESLWNAERKTLPGGELMAPVLAHKAYADWTEREVEQSLKELEVFSAKTEKPLVVFCGDYVVFPNEAPRRYIDSMSKQYSQYDCLLMSEASWLTSAETAERIHIPFQIVPHAIGAHYYTEKMDIPMQEEDSRRLHESEALCTAVEGLMKLSPGTSVSLAEFTIWTAYRYYLHAFKALCPKLVFIYNNCYYFHSVIDCVAKELGIEVVYWEYGPVPGTFMFDRHGLFSSGFPALKYREFRELSVTEEELNQASELFDYLKKNRTNRYVQQKSAELEKLKEELANTGKPVVLYIDQIDAECGMFPDTKRMREQVCPSFGSVEEGLQFISEIARRNEWEVIYKLHPIRSRVPDNLPEGIHVIHKCDINELIDLSDVTVVILSSVCFTASVRERPVVLLGYNEMRGKGCVYEAYDREEIEGTIKQAMQHGFTDAMKQNFVRYIALMNKYYLYDDDRPRDLRYGKRIEQFFEDEQLWA